MSAADRTAAPESASKTVHLVSAGIPSPTACGIGALPGAASSPPIIVRFDNPRRAVAATCVGGGATGAWVSDATLVASASDAVPVGNGGCLGSVGGGLAGAATPMIVACMARGGRPARGTTGGTA
ncbi:MAG: hypothetical protein QM784_15475 [Polyangiaceae bacterium]